jgi:hypothetical protein
MKVPLRRPRLFLLRLLTLLLLATIGVQASEPVRPLQHKAGSAFSAATADVAIMASRRVATDKYAPVLTSFVVDRAPAIVALTMLVIVPILNRPYSTGPPLPEWRKLRPAPARAPPLP